MNPEQYWNLEMQNRQNQQQQQRYNQALLMQGISDMAGAYSEQENMKATVKSGEKLLDVLGPSFGMTADKLKEFDYSNMNMREKAMFHQGWQSNFGTASQGYNFGQSLGVRQAGQQIQQNAPLVNAGLEGARRVAGGEGTVMLPEEPPLPVMDNSTLPPSQPRQPSPDAMSASDAWYNQSNRGMFQTGTMKPFYRTR